MELKILSEFEEGLTIKHFPDKGRGVVTTKKFSQGDFVIEYAGELIERREALLREERYDESIVGCYMFYFEHKNKKYCVDATAETGRLGRLINHSRLASNCHTKLVDINGHPSIVIIASRDISIGEELLYDYSDRTRSSLTEYPWLKW